MLLVLLAGTVVMFLVARLVAPRYGDEVGARFVEKGTSYTAGELAGWIEKHEASARGYAVPVLFPLDLLFMAFLAALLAVASVAAADAVPWLRPWAAWFAAVPALYLATDLAEGAVLGTALVSPAVLNGRSVAALQVITTIKIWSVLAAIGQTAVLGAAAIVLRVVRT
jgi:hypothetical protein